MIRKRKTTKYATAREMAAAQREISVAEFFAKNRHLLGFDNANKALLTTVKEGVDSPVSDNGGTRFIIELPAYNEDNKA